MMRSSIIDFLHHQFGAVCGKHYSFKPSFPVTKEFLKVWDGSRGHTSSRCCATTTNPSPFSQCGRTNSPEWRIVKDNGIPKSKMWMNRWKPKWRRVKLSSQQVRQDLRWRLNQVGEWTSQHKEGDRWTKECYEGQRQRESGWDDSKDGLTIH